MGTWGLIKCAWNESRHTCRVVLTEDSANAVITLFPLWNYILVAFVGKFIAQILVLYKNFFQWNFIVRIWRRQDLTHSKLGADCLKNILILSLCNLLTLSLFQEAGYTDCTLISPVVGDQWLFLHVHVHVLYLGDGNSVPDACISGLSRARQQLYDIHFRSVSL